MAHTADYTPPSEVCLLLRSHAEARWLSHEVVPVLRELEHEHSLGDEELTAARAYLEVLWIEACDRAAETEATCAGLDPGAIDADQTLLGRARRYHASVRHLRDVVALQVAALMAVPGEGSAPDHAST